MIDQHLWKGAFWCLFHPVWIYCRSATHATYELGHSLYETMPMFWGTQFLFEWYPTHLGWISVLVVSFPLCSDSGNCSSHILALLDRTGEIFVHALLYQLVTWAGSSVLLVWIYPLLFWIWSTCSSFLCVFSNILSNMFVCLFVCLLVCLCVCGASEQTLNFVPRLDYVIRGGRWSTKTPLRDPCKRTCRTLVAHLGAFESQLVATIVLYIYIYWSSYIPFYFLYSCMF